MRQHGILKPKGSGKVPPFGQRPKAERVARAQALEAELKRLEPEARKRGMQPLDLYRGPVSPMGGQVKR